MSKNLDVEGILAPTQDFKKIVKEGDTINLTLSLWPKDYSYLERFKQLEGKNFLNFFHIVKVYKGQVSKNNSDVFNIYFKAVLLKTFLKKPFYIWSINNKNIPIVIRKISTLNIKKKYDFYIYETIDLDRKSYIISVGVFVSVIIIIFLFLRKK